MVVPPVPIGLLVRLSEVVVFDVATMMFGLPAGVRLAFRGSPIVIVGMGAVVVTSMDGAPGGKNGAGENGSEQNFPGKIGYRSHGYQRGN